MISGPFTIAVSSKAEKLDFEALPADQQAVLGSGISFDPVKHDCYRFFILPKAKSSRKCSFLSRMKHRRISFERTNRVFIRAMANDESIEFLGIFPTTCLKNGQWVLDVNTAMFIEAKTPHAGLHFDATLKNSLRRDVFSVYAGRTNSEVNWYFLDSWLKSGGEFKLQILCKVEKSLSAPNRRLICDVEFQDDGRVIASAPKRYVNLPA